METKKFGIRDQIGYVCGDMAGSFVNLYVDAFFLTFCTYVLGIKATWMGTLFLFARLWDAFNAVSYTHLDVYKRQFIMKGRHEDVKKTSHGGLFYALYQGIVVAERRIGLGKRESL